MTYIIDPCCKEKQLTELLDEIEGKHKIAEDKEGTPIYVNKANVAHFYSYSDWDLNFMLPFFVNRTPCGEVTLCMVQIEQSVLETVRKLLARMIPHPETREPVYLVKHMSIITRGDNRKEILGALKGFGDRLAVCEDTIGFRCLTCANEHRQFVVQGSINQRPLSVTQMYTLTTGQKLYEQAQGLLDSKVKVKRIADWEEAYERLVKQSENL